MFARRFWKNWVVGFGTILAFGYVAYLDKRSNDKLAYAMRGRSNLFRGDHEKIKQSDPKRELWYWDCKRTVIML